jgi:ferric-dicitrate binding protein FerR (iron transport regulator)
VNKYPHTEHGRKARLWEKELAELAQAERIRQAAPDPNKQAENNEGRGNSRRWIVLGGAVGVAIAAGVVLVVLLRKKPRAK